MALIKNRTELISDAHIFLQTLCKKGVSGISILLSKVVLIILRLKNLKNATWYLFFKKDASEYQNS